jgi:hypothetical protein
MIQQFRSLLGAAAVLACIAPGNLDSNARAQFCDPIFGCFGGEGVVDVSIATDQAEYYVGDPITYSVTAFNPAAEPAQLNFTSSRQADYYVDNEYSPEDIALTVLTSREVPAQGSTSWEFDHPWDYYFLEPGSHAVAGEVVGYGFSPTDALFTVNRPEPVTDDVLVDFEHLPNGSPVHDGNTRHYGLWETAFIRQGVKFTSREDSVNLTLGSTGALLRTWRSNDNIEAEFTMPVFGVSAEVGSAVDRTVTMRAYDTGGQLLGSATSDPVTDHTELVGQLSIDSIQPIATVEWTTSTGDASLFVDNLFLNGNTSEQHGDFNGDGRTDAADYVVWRNHNGESVPIGSHVDGNHDGRIDDGDYELWREKYGWHRSTRGSAVPEPATIGLLAMLASAMIALPVRIRFAS